MDRPDILNLTLIVTMPDCTEEEVDTATRQLLMELKEFDVESVSLETMDETPPGAKSVDPITIGAIALAVLPTVLPKILDFLQTWSLQGRGRTIKFKGKIADQDLEYEGSLSEMEKLLKILEKKQHKSKK